MTPRPGSRIPVVAVVAILALARPLAGQTPAAGEGPLETGPQPEHTTLVYPPFAHTLGIHRARPVHLKLFLGDRTTFDDPQGLTAVKFTSDDDPDVARDDFQLTLFGVNSGRGEILYNSSMQTLAIYGGEGSGEGRLHAPHGIAATVDGRVYVADTGNRRVVRLRWDPVGRALQWVGAWPAGRPFDVTTDARGQAWASDRQRNAVLRFPDPAAGAGTGLLPPSPVAGERWPLPADVEKPLGLAVGDSLDPWYRPDAYRLYLVDRDGERLRAYAADGTVLAEATPDDVPRPGGGPGRFFYVALDYYGNVYVTDPVAQVVYKFDPDLRPLAAFPGPGDPASALEEPRGIAIWKRFGQVFVAEREGAQYFFVGTDFRVADPLPIRETADPETWAFDLFLTEAATVRATFLDAAGDTLAEARTGAWGTGPRTVRWGAGQWIAPPPPGWRARAAKVAIEARPTYSSRRKFARVRIVDLARAGP